MNKYLQTAALVACVLTTLFVGCKKPNPDGREDVKGKITLNGKPMIGSAGIHFDPVGDDKKAGGHGQIRTGEFELTGQDGVKPGKYIVRITCSATYDKNTDELATPETEFGDEYVVAVVPPEFNSDSTIEFEVVKGKKNVFNYDIQTDYVPERQAPKGKPEVEL